MYRPALTKDNWGGKARLTGWRGVRLVGILVWSWSAAHAADEAAAALELQSQSAFERVELSAVPELPEALACIQAQAAALPVGHAADIPVVYYRKGYCELLGATVTRKAQDYRDAAHDFERAVQAWPPPAKHASPAPVSSGLRVLASAAHLLADGNADPRVGRDLESAVEQAECGGTLMPAEKCAEVVEIGRLWLGWIAAREGKMGDAARWFAPARETGWPEWIEGQQALAAAQYAQAAAALGSAAQMFARAPQSGLRAWIGPHPDEADTRFRLGMAQEGVKDHRAAIASFDAALKRHPENARAIFLRGVARENLGQSGLADFELASRTAFANVNAPGAGGQAHLYRGVALYRRKDYPRAEQEFSSALNFNSGAANEDATAWRHMAAVAGGACGSSANLLEESLDHVSAFFPKQEAAAWVRKCRSAAISEVVQPRAR